MNDFRRALAAKNRLSKMAGDLEGISGFGVDIDPINGYGVRVSISRNAPKSTRQSIPGTVDDVPVILRETGSIKFE